MKIAVLRAGWLPTFQANGLQTVRMCEAFTAIGCDVRLFYIPHPTLGQNLMEFYDVKHPFGSRAMARALLPWRKSFELRNWSHAPAYLHAYLWCRYVASVAAKEKADFYYLREPLMALWLMRWNLPTVLEIHDLPDGKRAEIVRSAVQHEACKLAIAVTQELKKDLIRVLGIPESKLIPLHDGADLRRFACATSRETARKCLRLSLDCPLVFYVGQMNTERGVGTLLRAAAQVQEAEFHFVGGNEKDIKLLQDLQSDLRLSNVSFHGFVSPKSVPLFLSAADVLVIPHSGKSEHCARHASPLKLFEYMAAGRAIVCSDLPAHREILKHGETAWLVPPDDEKQLAEGIRTILADKVLRERLGKKASQVAARFSWEARAKAILNALEQRETHNTDSDSFSPK